jgi:hypothetical protein
MSNIGLPNNAGIIDTFTRVEGPDTVHMQAVVPVDPTTGDALLLAQQATLAAVQELNDTMLTLLSAMLKKMPRLASGDRMAVTLVSSTDGDPSAASGAYSMNSSLATDGTRGLSYYRLFEPWNFADMGAARLYSQISVS